MCILYRATLGLSMTPPKINKLASASSRGRDAKPRHFRGKICVKVQKTCAKAVKSP